MTTIRRLSRWEPRRSSFLVAQCAGEPTAGARFQGQRDGTNQKRFTDNEVP